jgi:hypothetical protein
MMLSLKKGRSERRNYNKHNYMLRLIIFQKIAGLKFSRRTSLILLFFLLGASFDVSLKSGHREQRDYNKLNYNRFEVSNHEKENI